MRRAGLVLLLVLAVDARGRKKAHGGRKGDDSASSSAQGTYNFPTVSPSETEGRQEATDLLGPVDMSEPLLLSDRPKVLYFENFLSPEMCDWMVATAEPQMLPSGVEGGGADERGARRSHAHSFSALEQQLAPLREVKERIHNATGIHPEKYEDLQVQRYRAPSVSRSRDDKNKDGKPEFYIPHLDTGSQEAAQQSGRRQATIIMFLSDVDEGGETFFSFAKNASTSGVVSPATVTKAPMPPRKFLQMDEDAAVSWAESYYGGVERGQDGKSYSTAGKKGKKGKRAVEPLCSAQNYDYLKVRAKQGSALLFYSVLPGGEHDPLAVHGGCPVLAGTKFISQQWIREGLRMPTDSGSLLAYWPLDSLLMAPAAEATEGGHPAIFATEMSGAVTHRLYAAEGTSAKKLAPGGQRPVGKSEALQLCSAPQWGGLTRFEESGQLSFLALMTVSPMASKSAKVTISIRGGAHQWELVLTRTHASLSLSTATATTTQGGDSGKKVAGVKSKWVPTAGGDGSGMVVIGAEIGRGTMKLLVGGEPYAYSGAGGSFFQVSKSAK